MKNFRVNMTYSSDSLLNSIRAMHLDVVENYQAYKDLDSYRNFMDRFAEDLIDGVYSPEKGKEERAMRLSNMEEALTVLQKDVDELSQKWKSRDESEWYEDFKELTNIIYESEESFSELRDITNLDYFFLDVLECPEFYSFVDLKGFANKLANQFPWWEGHVDEANCQLENLKKEIQLKRRDKTLQ